MPILGTFTVGNSVRIVDAIKSSITETTLIPPMRSPPTAVPSTSASIRDTFRPVLTLSFPEAKSSTSDTIYELPYTTLRIAATATAGSERGYSAGNLAGITVGAVCGAAAVLGLPFFATWWYRRGVKTDVAGSGAQNNKDSKGKVRENFSFFLKRSPSKKRFVGDIRPPSENVFELEGDMPPLRPQGSAPRAERFASKVRPLTTIPEERSCIDVGSQSEWI